uniref:Reverse transcriptase domain-containing protein n=1 Tax=Tanacetum cinerariifolium TaxID=118510 RepID=A0A6L2JTL4_TANCI|nr:reverse transcriptase domain-containing protein [Tanacetum cinerariifolium]
MSDSEHSTVTYKSISGDDGSLDLGSPGVIVYRYDGLPMMPEDLYAYVEAAIQEPPPSYFVPEPVYPEFMPPEDDVLPAKEQPLPAAILPTADLPGYINESNPEEEDNEDPKEDTANYPADRDDDHKEEEMSIRAQTHIPFSFEAEVDKLLAIPTLSPLPLTSFSSPLPQIPSPPFLIPLPPTTSSTYTETPLGYRAAGIRLRTSPPPPLPLSSPLPLPPPIILLRTRASMVMMRAAAPSTYCLAPPSRIPPLLPIPLPTSSLPLLLPSTDSIANVPEVVLPPRKRLCVAPGPRFEVRESSSAVAARSTGGFRADYSFVGTLDAEIRRNTDREIGHWITDVWEDLDEIIKEIPATDVAELGQRVTNFVTTVRQDTDEMYVRLDDAQDDRLVQYMDASDTTRSKVRALQTTVLSQQTEIGELRAADRRQQAQLVEALTLLRTLQTQMVTLQSQQRPARDLTHLMYQRRPVVVLRSGYVLAILYSLLSIMGNFRLGIDIPSVANALAKHEIQRNNNLNGDGSQGSGSGITRPVRPTRECTYIDFLKFKNQVKFATFTLYGVDLTWWKSHVKTVGHDVAYDVPWNTLMKELALLCGRIFPEESDKIEKYVAGLPDMIHESTENKRKQDDNQQQQNKRQNTGRGYTAGPREKKPYEGSKPLCSKCNYHHDGSCAPKCHKCNRVGHLAHDCRSPINANTANNQRGTRVGQKATCFECGSYGHFKRECPKPKNNNRRNQELGSFDVIIGMDWLAKYHVVIVCDEKLIRIPYGNETLIVHDDRSDQGNKTRLNIISCTKTPKNKKEHEEPLKAILELRKKDELYAKFSKCEFWIPRFVEGFLKIANSMTKLTQKGVKFDWGDKEEAAFQLIKQKLCSAPILALPKGSEDFVVYCDVSHKGLGIVLMKREKTISYASLQLKFHEKNYTTHDLELRSRSLQKALGTTMAMSITCHLETNGQSEMTIHTLEDMMCAYVIDFGKGWIKHFPLLEFSYNNSYNDSIKAALFEALYGRKCRSTVCWAEVLAKVGAVAYKLELPQDLSRVHNTFHVSNIKKCYFDEPLAIPLDGIHIDDKLHFMEEPIEIMDREVKRLKQRCIPIVKVRWNSRRGHELTWERKDQFQKKYPYLFTKTASSSSATS